MMKWIFGLLLLVNVVFFAVMQWGGALTIDTSNPLVQAELNADKIKIVSMVTPTVPVIAAVSAPEGATSALAPVASPVVVETRPVTTVTPPAVPVAPTIVALPLPPSLPAPVIVVPPQPKLSCMEWGEFSGTDLQRAENVLATMRLGNKLKQRIVEYVSGYWVYISPVRTSEQVKYNIAQLKKLDINEYFVVQEQGPWKNAISLGVFKTEESAKKYLANVQALGLKSAKVDERPSKLKFTVFVLHRLESNTVSRISALHKDFPESEIKQIPCN